MAKWRLSDWFGSFWQPRRKNASDDAMPRGGSDENVSVDKALQLGTVWACVRLLSETIGTLPLNVYQKDGDGGRTVDRDHPLYALLHDSPNADMTAAEFWEAAVACLCLWGNFYAEKSTRGRELIALTPLPPDRTKVRRDDDGARIYEVQEKGRTRRIPEDRVFHIRGFGLGGDQGLSPIGYARRTLALSITTDEAASSAMTNGVRPGGFLVAPKGSTLEQKKQLKETFIDPVTGPNATARVGLLEQGLDWKEIRGLPPEDMQLLEGRAFNVEELCRWFRVATAMIAKSL